MDFKLKAVLDAVGPTASLIFASWIFLSFLQTRYTSSYERYRSLVDSYRNRPEKTSDARHGNVADQIHLYKRRCELMKRATNFGVVAAILLMTTVICGALDAVFKDVGFLKLLGTFSALAGLLLVIVAACMVIQENSMIQFALDGELADIPDLAQQADVEENSSASQAA